MNSIDQLKWRYATKKFSSQKLPLSMLDKILEAANLTPTSYGLQAFKIIVIDDPDIREKLLPVSMNQDQITEASHLLVLCRYSDVGTNEIDAFAKRIGAAKNKTPEEIVAYSNKILNKIAAKKELGTFEAWLSHQVYIVLGCLLTTCAQLRIDSCPMEGFEPEKFDEILELDKHNLKSVVLLAVGFRAQTDTYQFRPKVRKNLEHLLIFK